MECLVLALICMCVCAYFYPLFVSCGKVEFRLDLTGRQSLPRVFSLCVTLFIFESSVFLLVAVLVT